MRTLGDVVITALVGAVVIVSGTIWLRNNDGGDEATKARVNETMRICAEKRGSYALVFPNGEIGELVAVCLAKDKLDSPEFVLEKWDHKLLTGK